MSNNPKAVAVYCGSSLGKQKAYQDAALSVGKALATSDRPLVYGGGSVGLMGVASGSALVHGGRVIAVRPYAMVPRPGAGGEKEKTVAKAMSVQAEQALSADRSSMESVIVNSMHERKVEMAKRVGGFIGLPGGFGTFEEVFEVTTWTQLGIHDKPVVLLNVLSFYEPIRTQIKSSIEAGFIHPSSERLILIVDGPSDPSPSAHESFDWGKAALEAIDSWQTGLNNPMFDWSLRMNGTTGDGLGST